jgi:hypothetical protein
MVEWKYRLPESAAVLGLYARMMVANGLNGRHNCAFAIWYDGLLRSIRYSGYTRLDMARCSLQTSHQLNVV